MAHSDFGSWRLAEVAAFVHEYPQLDVADTEVHLSP
jgi:hypothetical protein